MDITPAPQTPEPTPARFQAPKADETTGLIKTLHHPEGITQDDMFFNEERVSGLILEWKQTRDVKVWQKIVEETIPLIDTLILHGGFVDYDELPALRSECVVKLHKLLDKFDPNRGRAFTIFSISFKNFLLTYSQKVDNKAKVVFNAEDEFLDTIEGSVYVNEELSDEFKSRVMDLETRFHEKPFMDAMKYLVNYFLKEGFNTPKSKMCTTLCASYDLTPDNAYFLYDYTLVKMRSALYDMNDAIFTELDLLKDSKRWSLIPEMAQLIGVHNVLKLCSVFAGVNVTFPTKKDVDKLSYDKRLMDRIHARGSSVVDMKNIADQMGGDPQASFDRISDQHAKGYDREQHLFAQERNFGRLNSDEEFDES
jgi:hypothetical protein